METQTISQRMEGKTEKIKEITIGDLSDKEEGMKVWNELRDYCYNETIVTVGVKGQMHKLTLTGFISALEYGRKKGKDMTLFICDYTPQAVRDSGANFSLNILNRRPLILNEGDVLQIIELKKSSDAATVETEAESEE